jgi:polar amino acid transport system substrate-binding protein
MQSVYDLVKYTLLKNRGSSETGRTEMNRIMDKKVLAFLLAIFLLAGVTGVQARSLDQIISSGVIRVGINPAMPPLGIFNEKNEIVGFDAEFADEVAKKLGVKLEIIKVGSPDRIPFVATDKIDFVMGAMTRTSERAKTIDFTVPVHTEILGVLTTQAKPYKHWKDTNRADLTFVQVRGTTAIPFIEKNLPKAKLMLLDNYPDAVRALAQGRADAMIEVLDFMKKHMDTHKQTKWKILETPISVYYCCLGVSKGNYSLKDWLNVTIFELHRDGVIDGIWEKWFQGPMLHKVKWSDWF